MKEAFCGPCGIYCGACGAEDCGGCLSSRIDETITGCRFRRCAGEKELEFCGFCEEYPCGELAAFMNDEWPHHHTIAANLEMIRKEGKEAWLAAKKKEWTCPGCGAATFWYFTSCKLCGRALEAWELPEAFREPEAE